ncbi:hypothetical protein L1987_43531 [Smallanthus sonchifolius]|uniref:Uncharacterized protein n=1 Tax=Smallanthus sonchifolius TaxID=185202 RepID=A0ACB9GLY2_9ASTR|nr:hypothetical protein L1987_43531 [Smallanthus sonchifolius]
MAGDDVGGRGCETEDDVGRRYSRSVAAVMSRRNGGWLRPKMAVFERTPTVRGVFSTPNSPRNRDSYWDVIAMPTCGMPSLSPVVMFFIPQESEK